ncbi:MAG: heterodisulfide reductase-related iron-sulfur binding cluster [bacterium]
MQEKVAYFAGCTASFVEPEVGRATVRVLRRYGLDPFFPKQECCGLAELLGGNLRAFSKRAESNLQSLAGADADIVTACTSCALALKREYPRWVKSRQAEPVSRRVYDILEYVALLDGQAVRQSCLEPLNLEVAYHAPCHLKVMGRGLVESRLRLMRRLTAGRVREIDRGCCGMGGTFGLKGRNYARSMAIGQSLFEAIRACAPDVVATDCPGCKLQIFQGTGLPVTHPIQLLARAHGG